MPLTLSVICVILNLLCQLTAVILDVYDVMKTYENQGGYFDEYINRAGYSAVALFNMFLFNSLLFDIYKWGIFIISSDVKTN